MLVVEADILRHALQRLGARKHRINGGQDITGGAEGKQQRQPPFKAAAALQRLGFQRPARAIELARIGALEGIDRLFVVADGKKVGVTPSSRRPSPSKKSSVNARMIAHCWAEVSCASSTSTWSIR